MDLMVPQCGGSASRAQELLVWAPLANPACLNDKNQLRMLAAILSCTINSSDRRPEMTLPTIRIPRLMACRVIRGDCA